MEYNRLELERSYISNVEVSQDLAIAENKIREYLKLFKCNLTHFDVKRLVNNFSFSDSGCLIQNNISTDEYGSFTLNGVSKRTTKLFYENIIGPVPQDLMLCHNCDTPSCSFVHPDQNKSHIRVDTAQANMQDMLKRGRKPSSVGELNQNAKITDAIASLVWDDIKSEKFSDREIAEKYAITKNIVSSIRTGGGWNHISQLPRKIVDKSNFTKIDYDDLLVTEELKEKFHSMYTVQPLEPHLNTPCWKWNKAKDDKDYGMFSFEGLAATASQFSFFIANNKWAVNDVAHDCANRWCVNPSHLQDLTRKQNMNNPITKARQSQNCGSGNGNARLLPLEVEAIRISYSKNVSVRELANRYKVNASTINRILLGLTFKSISGPIVTKLRLELVPRKFTVLTQDDVLAARRRYKNGESFVSIYKDFTKVDRNTLISAIKGGTWTNIPKDTQGYIGPQPWRIIKSNGTITQDQRDTIYEELKKLTPLEKIGEMCDLGRKVVTKIRDEWIKQFPTEGAIYLKQIKENKTKKAINASQSAATASMIFSMDEVFKLRTRAHNGESPDEIAKSVGKNIVIVKRALQGYGSYNYDESSVDYVAPFAAKSKAKCTPELENAVHKEFEQGTLRPQIVEKYKHLGATDSLVKNMKSRWISNFPETAAQSKELENVNKKMMLRKAQEEARTRRIS